METIVRFPNQTNTLQLNGSISELTPRLGVLPTHHLHFFELQYCGKGEITLRINSTLSGSVFSNLGRLFLQAYDDTHLFRDNSLGNGREGEHGFIVILHILIAVN